MPADDTAAADCFEDLYDRFMESDVPIAPPTERIIAYVARLLERWPDLTVDDDDDKPWAAGPLISEARGPLIYFAMTWSKSSEASAYAAAVARSMGLNCFDPQTGRLRP